MYCYTHGKLQTRTNVLLYNNDFHCITTSFLKRSIGNDMPGSSITLPNR